MEKFFRHTIIPIGLILVLPLLGVILNGQPWTRYLIFPPKPVFVSHALFSLPVFGILALVIALATLPLLRKGIIYKKKNRQTKAGNFPWWGYFSLVSLIFFWVLAWTRFNWFAPFQAHTFFPLWISWIICVNALVFRAANHCPLLDSKLKFFLLFLASAMFWWVFEYLNRFVENWYYSGSQYPALKYFLLATLSFSTVLPAVESMKAYLLTFDRFKHGFKNAWSIKHLDTRYAALLMVTSACVLLTLIGIFPNFLFFCVWICPFFILLGCRILSNPQHIFTRIKNGDFTLVAAYAMAALICGFFWELFNMYSLARWQYSIPYVEVLRLFEMPILGYAGYLPFGLECAVIIDLIMDRE